MRAVPEALLMLTWPYALMHMTLTGIVCFGKILYVQAGSHTVKLAMFASAPADSSVATVAFVPLCAAYSNAVHPCRSTQATLQASGQAQMSRKNHLQGKTLKSDECQRCLELESLTVQQNLHGAAEDKTAV